VSTIDSPARSPHVFIVSGATGGIGSAIVEDLAKGGSTVVLLGRDRLRLEATREAIQQRIGGHPTLVAQVADITDPDSVDLAVAEVAATFGRLDGLVHAAGDGPVATLAEATDQTWRSTIDSKLLGAVRLTRAVAPVLAASGGGSVVFVNGAFHKTPHPQFVVNSAVNAALAAFAKAVSLDLGGSAIRVTVVDPGAVDTDLWAQTAKELGQRAGIGAEDVNAAVLAQTPLGALTRPCDVAGVVSFLLSRAAARITGTAITVDGGACAAL
jgi:3-oxoacyl-[acyl-carrier protein] reductase